MKLISVVIPTYNCGAYIADAIDIVLNQTYKNIEIIIVDDGSGDDTKDILRRYAKFNTIKFLSQNNKGPAAARNMGVKEAAGEYVAFLDADDLWEKDKLEKSVYFMEHGGFDWIATGLKKITMDGQVLDERLMKKDAYGYNAATGELYDLKKRVFSYKFGLPVHAPTLVIRKHCFEKSGLFDESLLIHEDTDLVLRFQQDGLKGGFLNEMLTIYRYRPTSITKNRFVDNADQMYKVAKKHAKKLGLHNKDVKRDYSQLLWEVASRYYIEKKLLLTLKFTIMSMFYQQDMLKMIKIKKYAVKSITRDRGLQNPKRILYYEPCSGFGGSSNAIANLIKHLNRREYCPMLAIRHCGPQLESIKDVDVIKLKDYPIAPNNMASLAYVIFNAMIETVRIYILIKTKKVAVVHINVNLISGIPPAIASGIAGIPCICHLRQTRRLIRREKILVPWITRFIVLNGHAYDIYKQDIPEEKLKLIYDGVDLDSLSGVAHGRFKKEMNFNSDQLVGMVGRIVKGKGQREFILAAKAVLEKRPKTKFVIIGDSAGTADGYMGEIRTLVRERGLEGNITLTGWRKDMKDIMADLDVLVQATTTFPEGFGLTIIEAMALSKPVIATDIPGPSDIVDDGRTGFLVPAGDIASMARQMLCLLEDGELCRKMGSEGRRLVEKKFDVRNTVQNIEAIYKVLLS
ncbi:MAG: glycosyltransferase [Candidatus Omnitrophica bacterium]|nr:glycosyltransferase [Candidatus Omnitrophota bacterium]